MHRALPAIALAIAGATAGCGAPHTALRARAPRPSVPLGVAQRGALPTPVQLPGLARTHDGRVLAVGGLDAADTSTATVTQLQPTPARPTTPLPLAAHDIGVTAIGRTVFAFGGGTAAGPIASVEALGPSGGWSSAGTLPAAVSDTTAVTLGRTAYVIGGYTTGPLASVLAFRPGSGVHMVARLPHPVRYAAAAAIGDRVYVAGGTTGTLSWSEIVEVDPRAHRARVVGRLPHPLSHAAGAALNGLFYVLGGRTDAPVATIWAFDPRTRRLRRAGRLPVALSDLGAVGYGRGVLVAGGRDRAGRVHAERWLLEPR